MHHKITLISYLVNINVWGTCVSLECNNQFPRDSIEHTNSFII